MIVYSQSGMEFHHKAKDGGKILQLGQFHMILVWFHFFFLILSIYCPQYFIYNIHNMKVFTIFLKIITCSKGKSQTVRVQSLLMNFSKRFFGWLNLYKTMTFLEKITIMDYNNGLYNLHHYVKNDPHSRMK